MRSVPTNTVQPIIISKQTIVSHLRYSTAAATLIALGVFFCMNTLAFRDILPWIILAAIASFIAGALCLAKHRNLATRHLQLDDEANAYIHTQHTRTERIRRKAILPIGATLCTVGLILYILANISPEQYNLAVAMIISATGVLCMIFSSILKSAYATILETGDYTPAMKTYRAKTWSKILISGFWPTIAIIYLAISIPLKGWEYTWPIWPLSALLLRPLLLSTLSPRTTP